MAEERDEQMFSRQTKESHLETIQYEIRMLRFCLDRLSQCGSKHQPEEEMWVVLEGFLLHYRNLVNFLSGRGGTHGDLSMAAPRLWAGDRFDKAETDAIQKLASQPYTAYSNEISTYLAHCTRDRHEHVKEWPIQRMYDDLLPALAKFEQLFFRNNQMTHTTTILLGPESYSTTSGSRIPTLASPEIVAPVRRKR